MVKGEAVPEVAFPEIQAYTNMLVPPENNAAAHVVAREVTVRTTRGEHEHTVQASYDVGQALCRVEVQVDGDARQSLDTTNGTLAWSRGGEKREYLKPQAPPSLHRDALLNPQQAGAVHQQVLYDGCLTQLTYLLAQTAGEIHNLQ